MVEEVVDNDRLLCWLRSGNLPCIVSIQNLDGAREERSPCFYTHEDRRWKTGTVTDYSGSASDTSGEK